MVRRLCAAWPSQILRRVERISASRYESALAVDCSAAILLSLCVRWCAGDHRGRNWSRCTFHGRDNRPRDERLDRDRLHHMLQVVADRDTALPEARYKKQQ